MIGSFIIAFIICAIPIAAALYGLTLLTSSIAFNWIFVIIVSAVLAVVWTVRSEMS